MHYRMGSISQGKGDMKTWWLTKRMESKSDKVKNGVYLQFIRDRGHVSMHNIV